MGGFSVRANPVSCLTESLCIRRNISEAVSGLPFINNGTEVTWLKNDYVKKADSLLPYRELG
jgi:hypothetical protein